MQILFTGKQGYEAIETVAKSLAKNLTLRESKKKKVFLKQ